MQAEALAPGTKLANPFLAEAKTALVLFNSATMSSMSPTIGLGYLGPSFDDSWEEEEDAEIMVGGWSVVGPPPPIMPPCLHSAETQPSALSTSSASMVSYPIIFDHR